MIYIWLTSLLCLRLIHGLGISQPTTRRPVHPGLTPNRPHSIPGATEAGYLANDEPKWSDLGIFHKRWADVIFWGFCDCPTSNETVGADDGAQHLHFGLNCGLRYPVVYKPTRQAQLMLWPSVLIFHSNLPAFGLCGSEMDASAGEPNLLGAYGSVVKDHSWRCDTACVATRAATCERFL